MSSDIFRSELFIYGLMFCNMAAVATGLIWAWRRGYLSNLDGENTGLESPDVAPSKEA